MAKDPDDRRTLEIPFPVKPLQVLMNVLRERGRTPFQIEAFLQRAEKIGLRMGDLEMLIGIRDYRQRGALLASCEGRRQQQ